MTPDTGTWHTLRLACREPFDGAALLDFLAARAVPGVEQVTAGRYARTIHAPGSVSSIRPGPPGGAGRRSAGRSEDGGLP